jgi:hypothetical protein
MFRDIISAVVYDNKKPSDTPEDSERVRKLSYARTKIDTHTFLVGGAYGGSPIGHECHLALQNLDKGSTTETNTCTLA